MRVARARLVAWKQRHDVRDLVLEQLQVVVEGAESLFAVGGLLESAEDESLALGIVEQGEAIFGEVACEKFRERNARIAFTSREVQ